MKTIEIISTTPACVTVSQNGKVLTTINRANNLAYAIGMAVLMCDPMLPRLASFVWLPDENDPKRNYYTVGGASCSGRGKSLAEAFGWYFLVGRDEEDEFEDWGVDSIIEVESDSDWKQDGRGLDRFVAQCYGLSKPFEILGCDDMCVFKAEAFDPNNDSKIKEAQQFIEQGHCDILQLGTLLDRMVTDGHFTKGIYLVRGDS